MANSRSEMSPKNIEHFVLMMTQYCGRLSMASDYIDRWWGQGRSNLNPLSPDMKMHILLTVLHTFLRKLVKRICLNIKTSHPW